jgi:murein DD-endopeptidase MepM/ murein hydrolase activator NlpD
MGRSTEIQQLLLQVDASVALAQRNLRALTQTVGQETGKQEQALERVSQAHQRMGKAFNDNGRFRAGMQQLSFQIGDVTQGLAMGTRASTIFAQQSGQVIQALQVMGGEGNKFLAFLSGPWGIVLSSAAVILTALGSKLLEHKETIGDLIDKMREHAKQAELQKQAEDIWSHSLDGLIERQKDLNKQLEDRLKNQTAINQAELAQAQHNQLAAQNAVRKLEGDPNAAPGDLAKAQIALTNANRDLTSAQILAGRQLGEDLADLTSRAKTWADKQQTIMSTIQRTHPELSESEPAARMSEAYTRLKKAIDDAASAGVNFNNTTRATDALNNQLQHGSITVAQYSANITKLATALAAAAKAAKEAKKDDGDLTNFVSPVGGGRITGTFGEPRPGHTHKGLDIATPVGTPVGAAAAGTVFSVGTLPGYGNVVIIDHGRGTMTRYGHLSKIEASVGQRVGQGDVIGLSGGAKGAPGAGDSTGPHLHFEVRRGGRPVDPRKAAFPTDTATAGTGAIRSAESDAERKVRQDNAFEESLARLNAELLQAKLELVDNAELQAEAAADQVKLEQGNRDAAIQNDVEEKKITQAQADQLKAKVDAIAAEKLKTIAIRKQLRLLQEQDAADQQASGFKVEALQYADENARTQAEHRRLQLEILDLVYEEKKKHLETLKAQAELAKNTAEAARIQGEIDNLPAAQSRDRDKVVRGTMDPLEAWAKQVPQSKAEVLEALHEIEARGLDSLANGLTDVITGTKSLGAAFKDISRQIIAEILQMTIKMLIFRAISAASGGGGGGFSSGSMMDFSGSGSAIMNAPAFAGGGVLDIGGRGGIDNNLLSINGVPRGRVSSNEKLAIIPSSSRSAIPANAGGAEALHVSVSAAPELYVQIESTSRRVAMQTVGEAAPHLVRAGAQSAVRSMMRPRLNGAR